MATELTDDDTGATVHTPDGDSIGRVTRVEDGVAYVEPDLDAPEVVLATLGWNDAGDEGNDGNGNGSQDGAGEYPLPRTAIDEIEEGEITLRRGDAEAGRSADVDHDPDADLAREADDATDMTSQEARERAREEDAEQDVEESIEREAAARESENPDAHRDEEPFNS